MESTLIQVIKMGPVTIFMHFNYKKRWFYYGAKHTEDIWQKLVNRTTCLKHELCRNSLCMWYDFSFNCTSLALGNPVIQLCNILNEICAEYQDMLPRPRLVCQEPALRPIAQSPGIPDKSSRGLGSMSWYSAQILICLWHTSPFLFLYGFGWKLCRTATMHSALCHCPLQ